MRLPRVDLGRLGGLAGLSAVRRIPLHMSGRQRKLVRWAAMGFLAIASFLIALKYTFPYERLKGRLIEAVSEKYEVTVGDVGHGFLPGTVVFENVVLRTRPDAPGEKPTEIILQRAKLDLGLDFGLLGALRKKLVLDIDADLGGGEVEASIDSSSSMFEAHVETEGLALASIPGVTAAVGLPMSGSLDAEVELRLPGGKWRNAEGRVRLDCDNCTVGDGVSKMSMTPSATSSSRRRRATAAAAAWGETGVTVPRLSLGETEVVVDISKGIGDIKSFSASSKDGWLKIEGKIEFRDPFPNTLFPGCMRFKLSDELKRRAPDFGNIEYTLSEKMRQADGSYALPTKGKLTELRWDVRRKCGGGSTEDDGEAPGGQRPGLAGRPMLDLPPQGGMTVEPSGVPGMAGAAAEQAGRAADPNGMTPFAPAPGMSGPALGGDSANPALPPGSAGAHDAGPGSGAATPPPPPGSGLDEGIERRMVPQPDRPVEGGNEAQVPPPEEGADVRPSGDEPPPQQQQPPGPASVPQPDPGDSSYRAPQ